MRESVSFQVQGWKINYFLDVAVLQKTRINTIVLLGYYARTISCLKNKSNIRNRPFLLLKQSNLNDKSLSSIQQKTASNKLFRTSNLYIFKHANRICFSENKSTIKHRSVLIKNKANLRNKILSFIVSKLLSTNYHKACIFKRKIFINQGGPKK